MAEDGLPESPECLRMTSHALNNPQLIIPGLLISSFQFETLKGQLREQGVTHILQVGIELSPSHEGHFQYHHLPIQDTEGVDLVAQLPSAFAFIDAALKAGGVVLVHCMMGISRSACTCIAYLMWKERLGFVQAAEQVYIARPCISPNPGFVLQLRVWERDGMDFHNWGGWSREKFLDQLEEWGGLNACMFDSVMRDAGVSLESLSNTPRGPGGGFGMVIPTPMPKLRPMPVRRWTYRICCIS